MTDVNIDFSNETSNSFELVKPLGEGMFSVVTLMKHKPTGRHFAVKRFKYVKDETKKEIMHDIDVGKSVLSDFKIDYYGHIGNKFSIWVIMEPMDISLKEFYQTIKEKRPGYVIEPITMIYFMFCSLSGLEDLHSYCIMHRDVKPTNMLLDKAGRFKFCDFGLSGRLKDSLVKSAVGTQAYLSPERINPDTSENLYSIKSDVWSLGISLMEVANFEHPFKNSTILFSLLTEVVINPSPILIHESYYADCCPEIVEFFNKTLQKLPQNRPSYVELKQLQICKDLEDSKNFQAAKQHLIGLMQNILSN